MKLTRRISAATAKPLAQDLGTSDIWSKISPLSKGMGSRARSRVNIQSNEAPPRAVGTKGNITRNRSRVLGVPKCYLKVETMEI